MNHRRAIAILKSQKGAAAGDQAAALDLAISALKEQAARRKREIERGVEAVKTLLKGIPKNERSAKWLWLKKMLKIAPEILTEIENRLGLPHGEGE